MKQNLPLVYLRSLIDLLVSFALIPSKSGMHRASVFGQIIVRSSISAYRVMFSHHGVMINIKYTLSTS